MIAIIKTGTAVICFAVAAVTVTSVVSAHGQAAPKRILPHVQVLPPQGVPQHVQPVVARPTRVIPPSHAGGVVTRSAVTHQGRPAERVEASHASPIRAASGNGGTIVVVEGAGGAARPRLHAALDYLIEANEAMRNGATNAVATEHVQQALHELSQSQSNPTFQGHRQLAIDRSIRAVHLLEGGSTFDEPFALTRDAINDLRFCVSAP